MVRSMREWWEDPNHGKRKIIRRLEIKNSILLGYDVFHHLQPHGPAVAWSTDYDIYFNAPKIPTPDTAEDIVFITGVNNHELAHIKYTPKLMDVAAIAPGGMNHPMHGRMRTDKRYQHAMNLLEDQRIETLMVKRYANQRPYFISAFTRIVLAESDHLDTAYLLARGRRYLPVKIRRALKRKFKVQEAIPHFRRVIDAYRKLNMYRAAGLQRGHELIQEFLDLVDQYDLWPQDETPPHEDCCSIRIAVTGGAFGKGHATEEATAEVAGLILSMDTSDAENDADGDSDGPQGHRGTGDIDAEDVGPAGTHTPGTGAGIGEGEVPPTDEEVAKDLSDETARVVGTNTEVSREVADILAFIRTRIDIDAPKVKRTARVEEEMPGIARRIATELRKLEADTDPYWETGQRNGRLNAKLAMRNPQDQNVFNRWQEGGAGGQEQEWVVLLDVSSSMDSYFRELPKAAWVMKKASDIMRTKMTVLAYGSMPFQVVYEPHESASGDTMLLLSDLAGTEPGKCLLQAHAILGKSRAPQRGLMVMTDGAWGMSSGHPAFGTADDIIKDMNGMGVLTHLVHFGSGFVNKHACRGVSRISDIGDLPVVMKELIKAQMKLVQR